MTIDVNVKELDEEFLDDIDEIIEDTMVQIFMLRSSNEDELENVKQYASEHNPLFYYAPASLKDSVDAKCKAYLIESVDELEFVKERVIYIEEKYLTDELIEKLSTQNLKGIILDATKTYPELVNFHISISPSNIERFDSEELAKLPMERIVLESSYPEFDFSEIFQTSKKISDINFRPDPSIIAAATKNSLNLFGFKRP